MLAESSYRPPTRLFTNGRVDSFTIAGTPVEVMPNRSDASDSVGFYLPAYRLLISNFMVPGFIFNVFSLRGGPYRDLFDFCGRLDPAVVDASSDTSGEPIAPASAAAAWATIAASASAFSWSADFSRSGAVLRKKLKTKARSTTPRPTQ